jgi:hypothetical protein
MCIKTQYSIDEEDLSGQKQNDSEGHPEQAHD